MLAIKQQPQNEKGTNALFQNLLDTQVQQEKTTPLSKTTPTTMIPLSNLLATLSEGNIDTLVNNSSVALANQVQSNEVNKGTNIVSTLPLTMPSSANNENVQITANEIAGLIQDIKKGVPLVAMVNKELSTTNLLPIVQKTPNNPEEQLNVLQEIPTILKEVSHVIDMVLKSIKGVDSSPLSAQLEKIKKMLEQGDVKGAMLAFMNVIAPIQPLQDVSSSTTSNVTTTTQNTTPTSQIEEIKTLMNQLGGVIKSIEGRWEKVEQGANGLEKEKKLSIQLKNIDNTLNHLRQSLGENQVKEEQVHLPLSKTPSIPFSLKEDTPHIKEGTTISIPQDNKQDIKEVSSAEQNYLVYVPVKNNKVDEGAFIKELGKVFATAKYTSSSPQKKLFLQLFPEKLGFLRIELVQKNDSIIAKIYASSEEAKKILQSQMGEMKSLFNSDVKIEKIEVNNTLIHQEKSGEKQQEQQKQQPQQHKKQQGKSLVTFMDELLNNEM